MLGTETKPQKPLVFIAYACDCPELCGSHFNRYALADAAGVQPRGTADAVFGLPVHGNLRYMCDGVGCV